MSSHTPPDPTALRRSQRRRTTPNPDRLSVLRPRKRLANDPTKNRDRLSDLQDGILHRILSHLPFDAAVRTSALSSRYRTLWRTNPCLIFPSLLDLDCSIDPDDYIEAVDNSLGLCSEAEHLTTLSFTIDQFGTERRETAARWAEFAAVRLVDELSFTFKYPFDDPDEYNENEYDWLVSLPESFFCCWSIVTLNLDHCTIPLIPAVLGRPIFPYLESVFLRSVAFTEDSISDFIASCPKIKKLNVAGTKFTDPIVISSSTLEVLDVYNNVFRVKSPVNIKSAPVLKFLGLNCDLTRAESVNLVKLEEAVLLSGNFKKFKERSNWRLLVSSFQNVKELVVDDWFTEFKLNEDVDFGTRPPIFGNLIKLDFCGNPAGFDWIRGLVYNISECPILEELYIRLECMWSRRDMNSLIFDDFHFNLYADEASSSENENEDEYEEIHKKEIEDEKSSHNTLSELIRNIDFIPPIKTLIIERYDEEPAVTTLIEFLLRKASNLNHIYIYYHEDCEEKNEEIIRKLRAIKPASQNVEILTFEESDLNQRKTRHDMDWNRVFYDD